jgi:uncharacterized membrane protein YjgN (DUF898 family)
MLGAVRVVPEAAPPTLRVTQDVRVGELFRIFLTTLALTILTLGFYRFWGRTNLRRYLWGHVSLLGDRFEYTGTARELLNGFGRAAVVMTVAWLAYAGVSYLLEEAHPYLATGVDVAWSVALMYLSLVGGYAARRYRWSRTRWRGIRGAQTGSAWRYAGVVLGQWLLFALTLGLYGPWSTMRRTAYELRHSMLGNRTPTFDGRGGDLFGRWLGSWILMLPTLGLIRYWYRAHEMRYVAEHTRWGQVRYTLDVSGGSLLGLGLGNFALLVLTLGLAYSVTLERRMRFWSEAVTLHGDPELATVAQGAAAGPASGEGLADFLDTGSV